MLTQSSRPETQFQLQDQTKCLQLLPFSAYMSSWMLQDPLGTGT